MTSPRTTALLGNRPGRWRRHPPRPDGHRQAHARHGAGGVPRTLSVSLTWTIDAPREMVWQQFTSPYLGAIPRDMRDSLSVIERGSDMVIASHVSDLGWATAETVEVVSFSEPETIRFRHLRGPVPHAIEEFRLGEDRRRYDPPHLRRGDRRRLVARR